jgi:hypothetical protein
MEIQDYTLVALLALLGIWAFYVRDRNVPDDPLKPPTIIGKSSSEEQQQNPALPKTLATAIAASIDAEIPAKLVGAPTAVTDSDPEESAALARAVVERVNANSGPDVYLTLTNVDSVAKTSDAYKTVFYDIVFNAYEVRTNVGVRLFASLVIPATTTGTMYVRELRAAERGLHGPADAGDGTCIDEPLFAPWNPVL